MKYLKNKIVLLCAAASLLFVNPSYADDIFKGVKGPTNWQIDERVGYSKNERARTLTNRVILKYWDGDGFGKWGFVSVPYKSTSSQNVSRKGLGDIILGGGPRGRTNNLNWFLYGALSLPTGDSEGKISLGKGRNDKKVGGLVTYLTSDKKFEIDGSLEYNFTGKDREGHNPPDELSAGIVAGGRTTKKTRFVTGLRNISRDGDYLLTSISVFRYTFSPAIHTEFVVDIGLKSKNIPKKNSLSVYLRYNF